MLETSQPWNLFGYDLRRGVHYFRAGWRDFLWGDGSPVLDAIDEVVQAHQDDGEVRYFRAWKPVSAAATPAEVVAEAIVLPEQLVLSKRLSLPAAAEAEIESVVALEVSSSSPFPESDTCFGWRIIDRRLDALDVELVISSQSAVMAHIAERTGSHETAAYEVWAQVGDRMVPVSGFGEFARQRRNRSRLGRVAAIAAYCLVAVMVLFLLGAGAKYLELNKVRAVQEQVEATSKEAVELRTALGSSKAMIAYTNQLVRDYPSVHRELQKLSSILGDDTWLLSFVMNGPELSIEGESADASAVMQQLLDNPAYDSVVAPVAIRKVRSGMERFVLKLTLASRDEIE